VPCNQASIIGIKAMKSGINSEHSADFKENRIV